MVLPPLGGGFSSHLSAREIKHIARAVHTAHFSQSQNVGVSPIFVSKDQEEDPRVEGLREALHKDYDRVVMSSELPPVRITRTGAPMGTLTSPW